MRGVIVPELCEGNTICVALAPDVFDLGSDGIAFVTAGDLDPDQVDSVRMAVDGCPRAAVVLAEEAL